MRLKTLRQIALTAAIMALAAMAAGCEQKDEPSEAATPTTTAPAPAPEGALDGHWEGTVDVAGQSLIAHVDFVDDGGALSGTIDFPQQSAFGLPLENLSCSEDAVRFESLPAPRTAIFDGQLQDANTIAGAFEQAGYRGTFRLSRVVEEAGSGEPLPYGEEQVTFANGDVTLAGTLTLPETDGPHPAVVLISGSGQQNRDEEIYGFKVFRTIADHLTREGIAVLRYDDRGIGGSSAGADEDTCVTFAGDVEAAVQYLAGRDDIDPEQIGLLGHSEGGIIAPIVATQARGVAFMILMAGTGTPGSEVLSAQTRLIMKADGASDAEIEASVALQDRAIEAAISGEGRDEVAEALRAEYQEVAAALPEAQRAAIADVDEWVEQMVESQMQTLTSAWMVFFLTFDPAPVLEQVTVPVLALFGGKDTQVPAEANRDAVLRALEKGGNQDRTAHIFPEANHLFQAAVTGSPNEYAALAPEFVPGFLTTIADWIIERVDLPGSP